jgi:hypothetical protein
MCIKTRRIDMKKLIITTTKGKTKDIISSSEEIDYIVYLIDKGTETIVTNLEVLKTSEIQSYTVEEL